jgi:hypothetical protein
VEERFLQCKTPPMHGLAASAALEMQRLPTTAQHCMYLLEMCQGRMLAWEAGWRAQNAQRVPFVA